MKVLSLEEFEREFKVVDVVSITWYGILYDALSQVDQVVYRVFRRYSKSDNPREDLFEIRFPVLYRVSVRPIV